MLPQRRCIDVHIGLILLLLLFIIQHVEGKSGPGKSRSIIYQGHPGSLMEQYLEMKRMYAHAEKFNRHLVIIQTHGGKGDKGNSPKASGSTYNLCDIFELPHTISCNRKMKMKCTNSTIEMGHSEESLASKKRAIYHCDPQPTLDSLMAVESAINLVNDGFPLRFQKKSKEEVVYVKSMIGIEKPPAKEMKKNEKISKMGTETKRVEMTALYWPDGSHLVGQDIGDQCGMIDGPSDSQACRTFRTALLSLVKLSEKYLYCGGVDGDGGSTGSSSTGRPGVPPTTAGRPHANSSSKWCYVGGLIAASSTEVRLLDQVADKGLKSFSSIWPESLRGIDINAASKEVMELGLLTEADTFISLPSTSSTTGSIHSTSTAVAGVASSQSAAIDVVYSSMVEYQRWTARRSSCAAHKAGLHDRVVEFGLPGLGAATTAETTSSIGIGTGATSGSGSGSGSGGSAGLSVPPVTITSSTSASRDISWCARYKSHGYTPPQSALRGSSGTEGNPPTSGPFGSPGMNELFNSLGAALFWIFSTRLLQLGLGSISVMLTLAVVRLCYTRWKLSSPKTF